MLIDAMTAQGILITGSYNFTWSAQARNAENLLILRDNPALLRRYLDNWQRHRDEAPRKWAEATEMNEYELSGVWQEILSDLRQPDLIWQVLALACLPAAGCPRRAPAAQRQGDAEAAPGNWVMAG